MVVEHILAVLGLITAFGAAIGYVVKLYKFAKAPNDKQDKRLAEIEKQLEKYDRLLDNDKRRLDQIEKATSVQMRALLAMVNHMIDNNHTANLLEVRKELDTFLVNR